MGESGFLLIVMLVGMKDCVGNLKVELYFVNDIDFLVDDNILINVGKIFCCVVVDVL